jgi:O-antigen ligase
MSGWPGGPSTVTAGPDPEGEEAPAADAERPENNADEDEYFDPSPRWPALARLLLAAAIVAIPVLFLPGITEVFPGPKAGLLRILAPALLLCALLAGLRLPAPRPMRVALGLLVLVELLAFALAPDRITAIFGGYDARMGLVTQLCMIGLALGAATFVTTEKQATELLAWGLAGAAVVALYAFVQRAGLDPISFSLDTQHYVVSTLGNQNELAGSMLLAIAFLPAGIAGAQAPAMSARFGQKPALGVFLVGVMVIETVVLFTTSRSGLLGFGLAVVALAALARLNGWEKRLLLRIVPYLAVALILPVVLLSVIPQHSDVSAVDRRFTSIGDAGETTELRTAIWKGSINVILAHPILGIGQSGEVAAFARDRRADLGPRFAKVQSSGDPTVDSAHNLVLETLQNVGICGLLVVAVLGGWVALVYWRLLRSGRSLLLPFIGAAALGWGFLLAFNPITIGPLSVFAILVGLTIGLAPNATWELFIPWPSARSATVVAGTAVVLGGFLTAAAQILADRQFTTAGPATADAFTDSGSGAAAHRAVSLAPWEATYRRREYQGLRYAAAVLGDRETMLRAVAKDERLIDHFGGLSSDYALLADMRSQLGLPGVDEALDQAKAASPHSVNAQALIDAIREQAQERATPK